MATVSWQLMIELWQRWGPWLSDAATGLAWLSLPSVVVHRRGRPLAAISWMLALLSLPVLGLVLWWLLGRRHLMRRRRNRYNKHLHVSARLAGLRERLPPPSSTPQLLPLTVLPDELTQGVFCSTSGNAVTLLANGASAFAVMEADIAAAEHHIHVLFYIWRNDETGRHFRDLLVTKAQQGVEVRVICDAVGAPLLARRFFRPLRNAGARVMHFNPPQLFSASPRLNFRNHRKIVVVDDRIGIIGGFNIADEYKKKWRDMGVRIDGPAVDQLQEIFADDWYYCCEEDLASQPYFGNWQQHHHDVASCAAVASGPDSHYNAIHDALFIAINQCHRRLCITTPYFIPTQAIVAAIRAAVYRGVDVRILLPSQNDVPLVRYAARAYYPELLAVGVRIFEYLPEMIHAKVMVFDDDLVLIGSANLDNRSFKLNFEASCFVGGQRFNHDVASQFDDDLTRSQEVTQSDLDALSPLAKLRDATAQLLSPLL